MQNLPNDRLAAINYETLSPMMQQYVEQKQANPDCLLFFRLGDFYEMFFDDALIASRELEIALTSRDCGQEKRAPMCGVPYHAADGYIQKLIQKNYKVAVSEQLEDPASCKGIVKRGIIRIVTPGTVTDTGSLDEGRNNYLVSVFSLHHFYGLAVADITTGEFQAASIIIGATVEKLLSELARLEATEIICNEEFYESDEGRLLRKNNRLIMSARPDECFNPEKYSELLVRDYDEINGRTLWAQASAGILNYIEETQLGLPDNFAAPRIYQVDSFLQMDERCRRHLELSRNIRDGKKYGSLLWVIDRCRTAMGQRRLRNWIDQPLLDLADIERRQAGIAECKERFIWRQEIREALQGMNDLARLSGKVSRTQISARELLALQRSLAKLPAIKKMLQDVSAPILCQTAENLDPMEDIAALIASAIAEDAPLTLKEGGLIRSGYNATIDELREKAGGGKRWIIDFEERERAATGIKNLKVGYNKVFGYYLEVSKSNIPLVPERYTRKQTLVNGERYVTAELKGMEDSILSAQHRLLQSEYECFCKIRETVKAAERRLSLTADAVANLDVLQGLAETADRGNYCRPVLDYGYTVEIQSGRHPVVEKLLDAGSYVPNDCLLDNEGRRLMILTGPNMGGKSTYMRQTALIILLAQMGAFVPAESAHIGIVDKLFTRIGATDDLMTGDSTFMVEMKEMAYILNQADDRSLLILDEVGRGTSTFDGLSIAWAIIERIADSRELGCRTLFATHYHELTDLAESSPGIFNCHVEVERHGEEVFFLHKISEGGADESYGIEVAALSGIPEPVVARAKELLKVLEENNDRKKKLRLRKARELMPGEQNLFSAQLQFDRYNTLINRLSALDIQKMNFMEAANVLYELHQEALKLKR